MTEAPLQLEIDTARQRLATLRTRAHGVNHDPLLGEALAALETALAALEAAQRHMTQGTVVESAAASNGGAKPSALHDRWAQSAIAAMPVGVFRVDAFGRCEFVNAQWCEMAGLAAADALGSGWQQAVPAEDRAAVVSAWQDAARRTSPFDIEVRVGAGAAPRRWVLVRAVPQFDSHDVATGYIGTLTDITEQRSSDRRFRLLFDANMIGIYFADAYGRITEANDCALDLFGYTRADLAEGAVSWVQMSPPEYAEFDQVVSAQIQSQGFCLPYEREFLRKDGSRVPVLIGAAAFEDARDHGVAFMLDISKRRAAERAREEVLAELESRVASRTNELATANAQLRHELAQRAQAEAALRESEALFASAFEQAPVGMSLVRLSDSSSRFNAALRRLLDYSESDVNPVDLTKLIHPDDMARVAQERDRVLLGETSGYQGERRYLRRSGEPVWVYATVSVVRDDDGTPRFILGHIQDISIRKHAEAALRASEERYRAVSELTSDLAYCFRVEPSGRVIFEWHAGAFSRITGFATEDAPSIAGIQRSIHPEDLPVMAARIQRLLAGEADTSEFRLRTKTGEYRWLRDQARAERDAHDPRILRIVGAAQDITDRRRAEDALRQSEERYRTVSELTSDYAYCYRVEPDGRVVFEWHTEAFFRITGLEIGEAQNALEMETILHPDDREIALGRMQRFLAGESDVSEFRIRTQSGDYRWLRDYGRPRWAHHNGPVLRVTGAAQDITEQRWAEDALRESEAKFRILAETVAAAIVIYQEGRLQYANPEVTAMLGYSFDELAAMSDPVQLFRSDHRELIRERLLRRLGGEPVPPRLELAMLAKDGAERWVQFTGGLIQYNGAPAAFGSGFDITERKQAEAVLRESETKFRTLAETIPAAVFIYQGTAMRYANPAAVAMTGFNREDLLGMQFWDIIHPDFRPLVRERGLARQRGEVVPASYELKICTNDGTERWVEFVGAVIDLDGQPAVLGTAYDVTARRRAEAALRISEERFTLAVAGANDGIWDWEFGTNSLYASPRVYSMLGLVDGEMSSRFHRWAQLVHRDDQGAVWAALDAHLSGVAAHFECQVRMRHRDDSFRWLQVRGLSVRDDRGAPYRMAGSVTDITERRRIDEETRLRHSELAHALRLNTMGEMVATLAHEINQPLAAILNYARGTARCLRSGGAQLAEVPGAVDRIAAEADRAAQIVRNLRDYVRKEKPRREWVDVSSLARRAAAFVEQEGRAVGATIDVRVLDGLPRVQVDPIQIEQVVVNLLLNGFEAVRHLTEGQRLLIVETTWDGGDSVSLIVRDSGPGLPAALAEQAFSAFFSTKPGGLGLGLTISRSIIEAHGGRLWLEPNPGGGVAILCTLPASREAYTHGG